MRTKRLAIAITGGVTYAAFVMLVASHFGPSPMSPEVAFHATPEQWAQVMLHLNLLMAAGLGLITGAVLYQD